MPRRTARGPVKGAEPDVGALPTAARSPMITSGSAGSSLHPRMGDVRRRVRPTCRTGHPTGIAGSRSSGGNEGEGMTMQGGRAATLVERRHADVRLAVATAARDLFVENHSTSVTVEAIAQRAGVSERTFYRHFPTKADIVMPLLERSMDRLLGSLPSRQGRAPASWTRW
ncbi:TetR family transcriptional regulator [Rhodococcus hoagii]|nr:TetR family transcriptional regulator [Prescottella equi]